MAQPRPPIAWQPLLAATLAGAALAGVIGWRVSLQSLDAQIRSKRAALKKLALSGGIPPTQEVMEHLTAHQLSLERRYQHWLKAVAVPPLVDAAQADPQLYFQEHLHEVQRTLDRLSAARGVPVPEQLGFPKELPPSDAVPRLLAQLSLMEEVATLLFEQDVPAISSLKVEDPEAVPDRPEEGAFLMRLPVRVRLSASLSHMMKALGALSRARPLIDVRAIRLRPASPGGAAAAGERLETELVLARYLVAAETTEPAAAESEASEAAKPKPSPAAKPRKPKARAKERRP
ncbi:MAG: hypothetical protein HYT90_01555 [Candidatus Omnitrophica bacterium]|nr:hypothetical protein [Candidatus Omnitrophota bacterium]